MWCLEGRGCRGKGLLRGSGVDGGNGKGTKGMGRGVLCIHTRCKWVAEASKSKYMYTRKVIFTPDAS